MCRFYESMECVCIFVGARIIFILAAFPAWRIHGQEGRRNDAGWSSLVARRAHNPEVVGSNPAPATKNFKPELVKRFRRFLLPAAGNGRACRYLCMYRRKTISCQQAAGFCAFAETSRLFCSGHRLGWLGIRDDKLHLCRLTGYVKRGYPLLDRFTGLRKSMTVDISVFC